MTQRELLGLADVVVTTPEKLDLILRTNSSFFDSIGLIVTDEGQLVEDASRGPQFELLLSRLRRRWPDLRFMALSAVIPDSSLEGLAAWLSTNEGVVSQSDWRPAVQRHALFEWRGERGFVQFLPDEDANGIEQFLPGVIEVQQFEFTNPATGRLNRPKFPSTKSKAQTAAALAYALAQGGAVLVYCSTPVNADAVADALLARLEHAHRANEQVARPFLHRASKSVTVASDWLGPDHDLTQKLRNGIAVHHGGIPDAIKRAIESDFRSGYLSVIVATSTLAQGINLPIRTVILHSTYRYVDDKNELIPAREYWNIAGRAGRAGLETEGMIIHLCASDADRRALGLYHRRRHDLEPIRSAFLKHLADVLEKRVSSEDLWVHLDSQLLAILVEEDVSSVDVEWLKTIFAGTFASIEASDGDHDLDEYIQVLRELFESVFNRVPDSAHRQVFATTGLSIGSCQELLSRIRDRREELQPLLTGTTVSTRGQLIEAVLDDLLTVDEIRPKADPLLDISELAAAWISGEDYGALRAKFSHSAEALGQVYQLIEDAFQFSIPWGISAYLRLAIEELELEESDLSPLVRYLPSMFKYGVPNTAAVWAVTVGVEYRSVALRLGNAYEAFDVSPTFRRFLDWASQLTVDDLINQFQLQGPLLEDTTIALRRMTPSSVIKRMTSDESLGFPIAAQVVLGSRMAILRLEHVKRGDLVDLVRDYDLLIDRNAIRCSHSGEPLGMLSSDIGQYLAPLMDAGEEFVGVVREIRAEANVRRIYLDVNRSLQSSVRNSDA